MYDGPSVISSAAAARPATAAASRPASLGQTCARRDAERGRLGDDPVGHRERVVLAARRESDHRHLRAWNELLDEREVAARLEPRRRESVLELGRRLNEREPALALAVGGLDDAGEGRLRRDVVRADHVPLGLRHAGLVQPLALSELVRRQRGGPGGHRMRQPGALGDPCGDADRPVGSRGDDPVDRERADEAFDRGLVLDREDAPAVGEPKPRSRRIAVDDGEPEAARARRLEQPELCRPCA